MNLTSIWTRWPGCGFLVALPAVLVTLVALRAGQTIQAEPLQDPPDAGRADLDLVVPLEVHRDLVRSEVVVLAQMQIEDLPDDFLLRGRRAGVGTRGTLPQPLKPE